MKTIYDVFKNIEKKFPIPKSQAPLGKPPYWVADCMKQYAREKCKEQREICVKELFNKEDEDVCQIVRLSPEPKFD